MATITHPLTVAELRVVGNDAVHLVHALRERRATHSFQAIAVSRDPRGERDACVACGYAEAGHVTLTAPERHAILGMLNQRHPQPLMRRSMLRKLTPG